MWARLLRGISAILLPEREREFVLGDLAELYAARAARRGRLRAAVRAGADLLASAWATRRRGGPRRPEPGPLGRPAAGATASVLDDVRDALRCLRREKAFVALSVGTLSLGIGSTALVFGMVNQLVLRPLPGVTDPRGAAYLQLRSRENPESINGLGLATLDFDVVRERADLLRGVASYGNSSLHVSIGDARPTRVWANSVYGDFFEVLGTRAVEGRLLTAADTRFGADPAVAVISHELRGALFGPGRPATGRTLRVNGRPVRVLGVTEPGFQGPERNAGAQMWFPYPALSYLSGFTEERLLERRSTMHDDLVLRLAPGTSPAEAEGQVEAILAGLGETLPEQREYLARLRPTLFEGLTTPPMWRAMTLRTLGLLAGVVALVLLVACANVASLLLARNVTRRGTAAVRRALGASAARIARSHLVQGLLLAGLGSAGGLGVAWAISLMLRGESLVRMPELESFTVDLRVGAFAFSAALATTLLFGSVPAVLGARFDLGDALREAGRRDSGGTSRLRAGMATVQVALSLALVVGGAMLSRTVANLYGVDTGMDERGVAVQHVELPSGTTGQDLAAMAGALVDRIEAEAGVERAALSMYPPHSSRMIGRIGPLDPSTELGEAALLPVTAGWFEVLDMTSVAGAPLPTRGEPLRSGETVLTAALAERLFGSAEAAVGRTVRGGFRGRDELRVIAVSNDYRNAYEPGEAEQAFFVSFELVPFAEATLIAKSRALDASVLASIRGAVEEAIADVPVADATPLLARLDDVHSENRLLSRLLGLLAAFAVALSAVGLYGLVRFAVASRRREFGIRRSLGARATGIAGLVVGYAGAIVLAGVVLGLPVAYALGRALESQLFGLEPFDVASYCLAVVLLAVAAAAACWAPTHEATRVDPVIALKSE